MCIFSSDFLSLKIYVSRYIYYSQCCAPHVSSTTLSVADTNHTLWPHTQAQKALLPSDIRLKVKVLVAQSCPTLWPHGLCSPAGSYVHGILQARILDGVAIPFSKRSSWPRDRTWTSHTAGRFFTVWATKEAISSVLHYKYRTLPS